MKNPLERNKSQILVPVLVGAAAAAAIAYFLISEDTAGLRDELSESLVKVWGTVKDKTLDSVSSLISTVEPVTGAVV